MEEVEGKVAFITGGASGIGLGMAKAFVAAGMKVVIADIRQDHLDAAAAWFAERQVRGVHALKLDVTDRAAFARAADEAVRIFGKIHVLCNNAGMGVGGKIQDLSFDDWDWGISVLFGGAVNGTTIVLPHILSHGEGGHIVNTSSISGVMPVGGAVYASTKAAIIGMSEAMRGEYAKDKVGVSVLCPGPVKSNIHQSGRTRPEHLRHKTKSLAAEQKQEERQISPLWMDAEECGELVLAAIRGNDLYILTHAEFKPGTEERFRLMLDSFPEGPVDMEKAAQWGFPLSNPVFRKEA